MCTTSNLENTCCFSLVLCARRCSRLPLIVVSYHAYMWYLYLLIPRHISVKAYRIQFMSHHVHTTQITPILGYITLISPLHSYTYITNITPTSYWQHGTSLTYHLTPYHVHITHNTHIHVSQSYHVRAWYHISSISQHITISRLHQTCHIHIPPYLMTYRSCMFLYRSHYFKSIPH